MRTEVGGKTTARNSKKKTVYIYLTRRKSSRQAIGGGEWHLITTNGGKVSHKRVTHWREMKYNNSKTVNWFTNCCFLVIKLPECDGSRDICLYVPHLATLFFSSRPQTVCPETLRPKNPAKRKKRNRLENSPCSTFPVRIVPEHRHGNIYFSEDRAKTLNESYGEDIPLDDINPQAGGQTTGGKRVFRGGSEVSSCGFHRVFPVIAKHISNETKSTLMGTSSIARCFIVVFRGLLVLM